MAVSVDQYIIRFYVSVNEAHFMDALHSARELGQIESEMKIVPL